MRAAGSTMRAVEVAARAPITSELSLRVRGATVRYGRRTVLTAVDLSVATGEVYALLGRNGSGKSSLVRVLLGLQRLAAGEVRLLGSDPWAGRHQVMRRVGFVAEDAIAPPEMTARQLLSFCRRLRGGGDQRAALGRLERFGVPADSPFRRLSKGQRKQVELTLALAHGPELLVLDDPTLGLDPIARRALFGELMAELAERGTTVFLTTHDLEAVEGVATRIAVLAGGRLLLEEPLEELKARFRRVRLPPQREGELSELRPLRRVERPWGVELVVGGWSDPGPPGLEARALSLEEIFAVLHGDAGEGAP